MQRFKIESLLSARLFIQPKVVGDRLYFMSDLSGRLSLYVMDRDGSIPEPLIPQDIALQQPHHIGGESFCVFPSLGKILLMIDHNGDENYQPMTIPIEGGIPEPLFDERFKGQQVVCGDCDTERNIAVFGVDPRTSPVFQSFMANLESGEITELGTSIYGNSFIGANDDYSRIVLGDFYTVGDLAIYLWEKGASERRLLFGTPLDERGEGEEVPLNGVGTCHITEGNRGLLFTTSLFQDTYGLGYFPLDKPDAIAEVVIHGTVHEGAGELESMKHLEDNRYLLTYNIDGVSYVYAGTFDEEALRFTVDRTLTGQGAISNGVLESIYYEKETGSYSLTYSTATGPSQIYLLYADSQQPVQLTRERALGIPEGLLAPGEDASYTSHDGQRISARLYLPSPDLGFEGKRPVIFYIHGGPQSQERPDFTWFSMPLIQYFTLNGFAVYVPNVRGSSGYGMSYMKQIDHDWGGQDRLDHVHAFELLRKDERLDMERVGVMGRSYGGYMTLTLAGRHPELWKAAVDMFGPYNLFTFIDRLPETWKTYFYLALGHPEKDRDFLVERSPSTYLQDIACPLLVIQGANDPRVVESESRSVVDTLQAQGKEVEYLVFENEGHDVLRFENKVRCYGDIVRFFAEHLNP